MGRTVVFEVGPVTMLISELRGVAGNLPDVYRAFGIEPADYKMAVLKTASNFQYFAPITSRVIRVDTRGPGQSDVVRPCRGRACRGRSIRSIRSPTGAPPCATAGAAG